MPSLSVEAVVVAAQFFSVRYRRWQEDTQKSLIVVSTRSMVCRRLSAVELHVVEMVSSRPSTRLSDEADSEEARRSLADSCESLELAFEC